MSTRQVLGTIGAIVGAYFGSPQLGYLIGSTIGGAIDPEIIKGPSVGDIAEQTSTEGGPRPIVFALSQPIAGNVIAQGEPVIVHKTESQGKGGPKVETESVYRTYAVGVCEGEASFVRIWRNGTLVWDVSPGSQLSNADNVKFIQNARFFSGSFDQEPSPDLEELFGVGTTPAHRGTCYMVMHDEDLTDLRGAIPQWTFQVQRCALQTSMLVALSNAGPDGTHQVMRSIDGENFELQETPLNTNAPSAGFPWEGIAHSRALALFVCVNSSAQQYVMTSFDAVDWTLRSIAGMGGGWNSVAWSEAIGLFAAVRSHATQAIMTSPDGINWTLRSTPSFVGAECVHSCEAAERFIAGRTAGGTACIMTSDDGITWTHRVTPNNKNVYAIDSYGLTVRTVSRDIYQIESLDGGLTWSERATGLGFGIGDLAFNPATGQCFAVSIFGAGRSITPLGVYNLITIATGHNEGVCYSESFLGWYTSCTGAATDGKRVSKYVSGTAADALTTPTNCDDGTWNMIIAVDSAAALHCVFSLADVVTDICARAGLPSSLIDVSALVSIDVRGFTITNQYGAFAALRSLSEIFLFDPASVDGKLKFIRRGGNSVATITEDDFLDDQQDVEQNKRADAIAIPRVVHLNYHDVAGGMATDKQTSERSGDRRATGELSTQTAVLMTADEAAQIVSINHRVMIENQRGELKFQLSDRFIRLTPTDVVILQWQGRSVRVRLDKVEIEDGSQSYTAFYDRQSAYTSHVEGIPAAPQTPPPSNIVGPTLVQPLDIHILQDADDAVGLSYYVAVSGVLPAWTGAQIDLSFDGGANYIQSASTRTSAVMGTLLTALDDHPQEFPDVTHTPTVVIQTPGAELHAVSDELLLSRDHNLCIIDDEMVQFRDVDEVAEGQWQLSYLLRGRKGTATMAHAVDARFVMLDRSTLAILNANLSDIGRTFTFRATSFGTSFDLGTVVSMVYTGQSQTEREVAYLSAHKDGSDAVVTWQGVGRLGSGITVAHGSRFAGYRVRFDDGVMEETVDTDAEELTHDISAFSLPLTIAVSQLNDLTGAGPEIEVILT